MNCRNLYLMIDYFNTFAFALIVSGIMTPDFFMFLIYFFGFIKLNRYYDKNKGIGLKSWILIYTDRYLRLAPMYYIVFFLGWWIYPFLSDRAGWFVSERLFMKCDEQWHYVLLMVNTLVPFFTKCLEGCYYWTYVISNDLLLYPFFPLWIIIYKKNKYAFYAVNTTMMLAGFFINGYITYKNDLKVGIFTFEDYYLFSYLFNKPYTKLVAVS